MDQRKPYGQLCVGRSPYLDRFFFPTWSCFWPVAVFGRMQRVYVQQHVDKKPSMIVWPFIVAHAVWTEINITLGFQEVTQEVA